MPEQREQEVDLSELREEFETDLDAYIEEWQASLKEKMVDEQQVFEEMKKQLEQAAQKESTNGP